MREFSFSFVLWFTSVTQTAPGLLGFCLFKHLTWMWHEWGWDFLPTLRGQLILLNSFKTLAKNGNFNIILCVFFCLLKHKRELSSLLELYLKWLSFSSISDVCVHREPLHRQCSSTKLSLIAVALAKACQEYIYFQYVKLKKQSTYWSWQHYLLSSLSTLFIYATLHFWKKSLTLTAFIWLHYFDQKYSFKIVLWNITI